MIKISLFIGFLSFVFSTQTYAKGMPIFFQTGAEVVSKAHDLPNTEEFQIEDNSYMELGIFRKQFTIMFIPLWNYDVKWCGYIDDETMIPLTQEEVDMIAKEAGLELSATPSLPFWSSIGGKLLFVALIGAFIAFTIMKSDDDDDDVDNSDNVTPNYGPAEETKTPSQDEPKA